MDAQTYYELEEFIKPEPWTDVLRQRVDNGVEWLDDNFPGWYNNIRVSVLELASGSACICGQVFSEMWQENTTAHTCDCEYCEREEEPAEEMSGWDWWNENYSEQGSDLGFDTVYRLHRDGFEGYRDDDNVAVTSSEQFSFLTEEWIHRVEKKLANDPSRNSFR